MYGSFQPAIMYTAGGVAAIGLVAARGAPRCDVGAWKASAAATSAANMVFGTCAASVAKRHTPMHMLWHMLRQRRPGQCRISWVAGKEARAAAPWFGRRWRRRRQRPQAVAMHSRSRQQSSRAGMRHRVGCSAPPEVFCRKKVVVKGEVDHRCRQISGYHRAMADPTEPTTRAARRGRRNTHKGNNAVQAVPGHDVLFTT